nr:hypothetical protein [Tanacetum cinerariifolium]
MSSENGVIAPAPNSSHKSSFSLLSVLGRERLTADYNQFVLSHQMNAKETSIMKLHSLLQTVEQGIKRIDVPFTSAAPVMAIGHNAKKRKSSHSNWKGKAARGKSDRGSKRKDESEIAPTNDPKEAVCFYYNTKGHWKRSCPKYLKDLKDENVKKGNHSGLKESRRLKHGELNLIMGNRKITPVTRIGKFELMLKSGSSAVALDDTLCLVDQDRLGPIIVYDLSKCETVGFRWIKNLDSLRGWIKNLDSQSSVALPLFNDESARFGICERQSKKIGHDSISRVRVSNVEQMVIYREITIPLHPIMRNHVHEGEDIELLAFYGILFLFIVSSKDAKCSRLLLVNILSSTTTLIPKPVELVFQDEFDVCMVPFCPSSSVLGFRILHVQFSYQPFVSVFKSRSGDWEVLSRPGTQVPTSQPLQRNNRHVATFLHAGNLVTIISFQIDNELVFQTHLVAEILRKISESHELPAPLTGFAQVEMVYVGKISGEFAAFLATSASTEQGMEDICHIQMLMLIRINPELNSYVFVGSVPPSFMDFAEIRYIRDVQNNWSCHKTFYGDLNSVDTLGLSFFSHLAGSNAQGVAEISNGVSVLNLG